MPDDEHVRDNYRSPGSISRRHLIIGAGALVGGLALPIAAQHRLLAPVAHAATDDIFDALRATWCDLLTGGTFDGDDPDFAAVVARLDDQVDSLRNIIDRSAGRPGVFVDMPFVEEDTHEASALVPNTLGRLERMATAVHTPGSRYEGDQDLIADVLAGLDTTNVIIYHAGRAEFGNWYHWEISGPNALMNTCALLLDDLPEEARQRYVATVDHFIPDPHYQYIDERRDLSTGSNRMWLCEAVAVRGIIDRNEERLTLARDGLTDVFVYVNSGDGLYRDGSYLYHSGLPYTGSYGVSFVDRFSKQLVLYAGTPWEIGGEQRDFAFGTVDLMLAPVVYDNIVMDSIRGRSIARPEGDHGGGHLVSELVLRLAGAADAETAVRWRSMAKGWLERDTFDDPSAGASIQRLAVFKEVLNDSSVAPAPEPVNHTLFARMARSIHRRPAWAYTIAMSSARVSWYEVSSEENLKGWHTADGMTYLYGPDNGQYTDAFWPTVDPYRLPGITVDTRRLPEMAGVRSRPDSEWVGGAVLADEFAAIGMELNANQSSLRAKKSWFCLDDRIVALGADITGGGGHYAVVVADAHVNAGDLADDNFGSDNRMLVKSGSPRTTREAYLAFDVSDVASDVLSVTLHLYAQVQDSGGTETDIDVHGVVGSWDESTLTWNTRPETGERLGTAHVDQHRRWLVIDVTDHVRDQLAQGNERVSLAIRQGAPGLSVWVASREYSNYAYDPFLSLTLAEPTTTVETVVENRNLRADGTNALVVDGVAQPGGLGWSDRFDDARWAHLEGVGGYLFPGGATLHALREERTGSWQDINGGGSPNPITRRYVTLWIDHGAAPDAARYAYVLLPGVSSERTAELAADPGLTITNSEDAQLVRGGRLGLTAVNFWRPGTAGGITVDQPCSVVVRRHRATEMSVAIADPTHRRTSVSVDLDRAGFRDWTGDDTVTVTLSPRVIRLSVDVGAADGRTHQVTFRRA